MTDVFDVPGVDALFDADLADFVKARDALAKQRKAEGDKDGAAAVKALRKPSTVAWGVNRVARANPDDLDALLDAGAAVRDAQRKAVQGLDDGALRRNAKAWRDRVHALAAKVAAEIGEQYRDEAAASFEAASTDDALAQLVKRGRLTNAIEAAGFGLAGMPDPPVRVAAPVRTPAPVSGGASAASGDEAGRGTEERDEADEAARDAAALAAAEAELAKRDKALEQALHRLRRAEQRLDQARAAVDEARLAHRDATDARDNAAEVVASFTSR